jgi:hypothetical protein
MRREFELEFMQCMYLVKENERRTNDRSDERKYENSRKECGRKTA